MRIRWTWLVAAAALLTLTACGGGAAPAGSASAASTAANPASGGAAPTTAVQLAAYQGADRQQILEAGARKEGTLTWYTTLAGPIIDSLAAGFSAKYPFLKVDIFRADEAALLTRATQEAQANKPVFDVIEMTPTGGLILADNKLITPYFSPSTAKLPDNLKTPGGNGLIMAAADRVSYIGFGYNTTLIPEAAVPKKLDDLMNPALTGKITLAGTATGTRWLGAILNMLGDGPGHKWIADFGAKQKPGVQQISGKAVLDLIAKGEVPASTSIYLDHVEQAKVDKAPVEWVPLQPVVANVGSSSLDVNAPHPNAALLYIDYVLGDDGQNLLKKESYLPATEKVSFDFWVPETGKNAAQVAKDDKDWSALFKDTFR